MFGNFEFGRRRLFASGAIALAISIPGFGSANAAPFDVVADSTCSFDQLVAATTAISPEEGDALARSPLAGQMASYLELPSTQRRFALQLVPNLDDQINRYFGGPGGQIAYGAFATCTQF